jgi:hypothetical protein
VVANAVSLMLVSIVDGIHNTVAVYSGSDRSDDTTKRDERRNRFVINREDTELGGKI